MCSYCRTMPAILTRRISKLRFTNVELSIRSKGADFVFTLISYVPHESCGQFDIIDGKIDWKGWDEVYASIKEEADFMCDKVMKLKAFI